MKKISVILFGIKMLFGWFTISAQQITLTLNQTIEIAADSSLQAFRAENQYMASYWSYRSFKAGRLPSLSLQASPLDYRRDFTRRYDFDENIDVYRRQQALYSYGNLSLTQNLDLTGGTFFVDSELGFMRNLSDEGNVTQFLSVPFRIGYSQSLFGFNSFKWERKIEPLKFEKAKVQYLYAQEEISETTIQHFFALAIAQLEHDMAQDNVKSADMLYKIGQERHEIAAISQADLLTLKLEAVNAKNALQNASINLKRAMFNLVSFLNLDKQIEIKLLLPGRPVDFQISPELALDYARTNNPNFLANKQELLEAEREVERTKRSSNFEANISASVGFSQAANTLPNAYLNPLQQDVVRVGIFVPIVDWGVRKGRVNVAVSNLNVTKISIEQRVTNLEQEVIMTVNDFNIQQDLIQSAEEALNLSIMAYETTKERFIIGRSDLSSLTLSLNRQNTAQRNYLSALREYWTNYYKLRKLTLYDFGKQESLMRELEFRK
jgi:outer membrane protein TolC